MSFPLSGVKRQCITIGVNSEQNCDLWIVKFWNCETCCIMSHLKKLTHTEINNMNNASLKATLKEVCKRLECLEKPQEGPE